MIDNVETVGVPLVGTQNNKGNHKGLPLRNYNRRSIRLKHYEYSKAGCYFITICTQDRVHLFGEIVDGVMVLGDAGRMVEKWHMKLEDKFPNIKNHEMVIMPNHIHFIMEIVGADPCVRPYVGDVVQWFKTMTTNAYIQMVKKGTCPPFNKRIWQRNYYEHVIRDDVDYERVATYTVNNPKTWEDDVLSKNAYP